MLVIVHDWPTRLMESTVEAVKLRKLPKDSAKLISNTYSKMFTAPATRTLRTLSVSSTRVCIESTAKILACATKLPVFFWQEPTMKQNSLCKWDYSTLSAALSSSGTVEHQQLSTTPRSQQHTWCQCPGCRLQNQGKKVTTSNCRNSTYYTECTTTTGYTLTAIK